MIIKVRKIRENARIPERASNGAIGYDVYASIVLNKITKEIIGELPVTINPGESALIGIGVQFAISWPYEAQVRPRSGLACKNDIELSNSPGTIDPDFRGEAGILLRNRGSRPFMIEENMRIAQLIFSKVALPVFEETDKLPETIRGGGGFGSTGLFEIIEGTLEYEKAIAEKDKFYMSIVELLSERSTSKSGCLIVKNFNATMGLKSTVCAVLDAIGKLTSMGGVGSKGADVYINVPPCDFCTKLIIQTEMESVILPANVNLTENIDVLKDAGVNIRYVEI